MSQDLERMAYDLQLFEFTADQVSSERKHLMTNIIGSLLKNHFESMLNGADCKEQLQAVESRMRAACDEKLAAIDKLDQKYFTVPKNVLLAHDTDLLHGYTNEDEKIKDAELEKLKQLYLDNSVMLSCLKMENEKHESITEYIENEQKVHELVLNKLKTLDYNKLNKFVHKFLQD